MVMVVCARVRVRGIKYACTCACVYYKEKRPYQQCRRLPCPQVRKSNSYRRVSAPMQKCLIKIGKEKKRKRKFFLKKRVHRNGYGRVVCVLRVCVVCVLRVCAVCVMWCVRVCSNMCVLMSVRSTCAYVCVWCVCARVRVRAVCICIIIISP